MAPYPFATLREGDIRRLQEERLHDLEVSLVRVLLKMREVADDWMLIEQHADLVARMHVHRADLGLPPVEADNATDGESTEPQGAAPSTEGATDEGTRTAGDQLSPDR